MRRGCSCGGPGSSRTRAQPNTTETSIAKLYATESAVHCANTAIQVHGGAGYVDDHPVERYFRDVRVTTLYEGTSQIQKPDHRPRTHRDQRTRSDGRPRRAGSTDRGPDTIAVVGAGTMGAGIAELACRTGARTLLHDPVPEALARGAERLRARLERSVARGRLTAEEASAAAGRLEPVGELGELAPAGLVIEAGPESLELKRELFGTLSRDVVGADCVLATNTSSLLVTAIAAAAQRPGAGRGDALLQPRPRDGAPRGRRRRAVGARPHSSSPGRPGRRWAST